MAKGSCHAEDRSASLLAVKMGGCPWGGVLSCP